MSLENIDKLIDIFNIAHYMVKEGRTSHKKGFVDRVESPKPN